MEMIDKYWNNIDSERVSRARELRRIESFFENDLAHDNFRLASKLAVVMCYAHWEGFYNFCAREYLKYLRESNRKVVDVNKLLIAGCMSGEFDSLRDRNHSHEAVKDFISGLKTINDYDFGSFDARCVLARSNLDFDRLSLVFELFGFDIDDFEKHRIKIKTELAGWRHAVAHGDEPDLDELSVSNHIELVENLLLTVSDKFQEDALRHL